MTLTEMQVIVPVNIREKLSCMPYALIIFFIGDAAFRRGPQRSPSWCEDG